MSIMENKEISRRVVLELWNENKVELLEKFHAPNFVMNDPELPVTKRGYEAAKFYFDALKKPFPDLKFTVDEQVAEGDIVVNFLTVTGTHAGEFLGLPPTHIKATVPSIVRFRFENGRIVEAYNLWDALGLMKNLGAMKKPELEKEKVYA